LAGRRFGAPTKPNLAGMIWRPDKTTSLCYEFFVGFVHKNWYAADTHTDGGREGWRERWRETQTETQVKDLLASGVPPKGLEAMR
jgi:hypothetical protein